MPETQAGDQLWQEASWGPGRVTLPLQPCLPGFPPEEVLQGRQGDTLASPDPCISQAVRASAPGEPLGLVTEDQPGRGVTTALRPGGWGHTVQGGSKQKSGVICDAGA